MISRLLLLLALTFGSCACTSVLHPQLRRGAQSIVVYTDPTEVPATCVKGEVITIEDGNLEYQRGVVYEGSYDRALIRLRNSVASDRGNSVAILEQGVGKVCIHCEIQTTFRIRGQVLRCSDADRPNIRLNPPVGLVTAVAAQRNGRAGFARGLAVR